MKHFQVRPKIGNKRIACDSRKPWWRGARNYKLVTCGSCKRTAAFRMAQNKPPNAQENAK